MMRSNTSDLELRPIHTRRITERETQHVRHRSSDQPYHLTRVRQLPCEDVDAVVNAAIGRVLNARAIATMEPESEPDSDDADAVGGDACPS